MKIVVAVGQQVHDWTVVDAPDKGKVTAECACGNIRTKWACDFFAHPRCNSCAKRATAAKVDTRSLVMRSVYSAYKSNARSDGRDFSLEFGERFISLVSSNCYYCNEPPARPVEKRSETTYVNGIDRLDSSVGYNWDNVVSCCTKCNLMKNVFGLDEFKEQVSKIYYNLLVREVN